jgi:integrase
LRIEWSLDAEIARVIYREEDGSVPFVDWFEKLPDHAQDKVLVRMERLRELGHELRRPEADFLRDGIHELRATSRGVHYRVLYFFHGQVAHTFRHSYRSWLDETGAPLTVQKELMRHASIQTTMNIYGKAMTDSKRQAHSKVVEMVLNSSKNDQTDDHKKPIAAIGS